MKTSCRLSIVIPTYNRPEQLDACLRSLASLELPAHGAEVIVVNDGGTKPNVAVFRKYEPFLALRLYNLPHKGPSIARNSGAWKARGTHLAFLDDDCIVGPDWFVKATTALEAHPKAMLGGITVNGLPANPYSATSQMLIDYLYAYQETAPGLRFFTSNNIIIPTASFRRLGGFNIRFMTPGGEDRDLCYRWQQGGGRLVHIPDLTVYHYRQMNLSGFWQQHYSYGLGALRIHAPNTDLAGRHLPRLEPLIFYLRMLTYARKQQPASPRLMLLRLLIVLSQLAYAAGVGRALLTPRRPSERT